MSNELNIAKKIIIALDVKNRASAFTLVEELISAKTFKIGLKLFTAEGPGLIHDMHKMNKHVFLDLKLHDIPNTVADTVKVCTGYGVKMMTLHTSGGKEMMVRAAEAAHLEAKKHNFQKPLLMGVTVLTSLNDESIREIGIESNTVEQVIRLAKIAQDSGMDGVVCSPKEIEIVKKETKKGFLVVTPGIRPDWAAANDQKRITTPTQAIKKGADYLVIGRPVIAATSPQKAFNRIIDEIKNS